MASYNKVMIIGNLTRDPEIKYTPKGTAIADIGLAVNRNYTTDSGEKREEVTFIDVTLWGRVAEIVGEYCKKGRPLFVEGRLQLDSWDDKATGQKRSKLFTQQRIFPAQSQLPLQIQDLDAFFFSLLDFQIHQRSILRYRRYRRQVGEIKGEAFASRLHVHNGIPLPGDRQFQVRL